MILGVDEVGRGCWAGPVVAGAVMLRRRIPGLADSKKLSREQRVRLDTKIRAQAVALGLGWVSPSEIDDLGMTEAVRLAMMRAVAEITGEYDEIIIDGNYNYLSADPRSRCLVKADDQVAAVSAASIIAKVARDAFMRDAALRFPGYYFERHVGYGTAAHIGALKLQGVCELHRRSFAPVRAMLAAV
ncbi:MAG TPA: ribonuclease HII [Candidatus Saccharimonadales bacterium]|nr:ribonuclease HII [Candidatus Saccharimonadales bacterium]